MSKILQFGKAKVTIPATESIAVYTKGSAKVYRELGYPNEPTKLSLLGTVLSGQTVFGAYASGATIVIEAGADDVEYEIGVAPIADSVLQVKLQADPGVLNATGALTAALILSGIVTSTTAAAVAGTLPTG